MVNLIMRDDTLFLIIVAAARVEVARESGEVAA